MSFWTFDTAPQYHMPSLIFPVFSRISYCIISIDLPESSLTFSVFSILHLNYPVNLGCWASSFQFPISVFPVATGTTFYCWAEKFNLPINFKISKWKSNCCRLLSDNSTTCLIASSALAAFLCLKHCLGFPVSFPVHTLTLVASLPALVSLRSHVIAICRLLGYKGKNKLSFSYGTVTTQIPVIPNVWAPPHTHQAHRQFYSRPLMGVPQTDLETASDPTT